jgi:nucleoside-diphosphate-sugar epimerase
MNQLDAEDWKETQQYAFTANRIIFQFMHWSNINPSHFSAGSSSTYSNFSFGWVNVKDVALAHILAYEVPSANGRYCMVERVLHYWELVNIIHKMYPTIPLPDKLLLP